MLFHNLRHLNLCYLFIHIMLFCLPYLVSYMGELHWIVVCIVQKPVIPWSYQLMCNTFGLTRLLFCSLHCLEPVKKLHQKVHQVKHKQPYLSRRYLHVYFKVRTKLKSLLGDDVWSVYSHHLFIFTSPLIWAYVNYATYYLKNSSRTPLFSLII